MRLAILCCNTDSSAFAAAHPGDEARFAALLRLARPGWAFEAVDAVRDILPEGPAGWDGVIVTGSPASANDDEDWIGDLKRFIRAAEAARVPLFGACFGHQVIAAALGGRVARAGWRLGLLPVPGGVVWGGAPGALLLPASHEDQVTALPQGATLLAGTADCPVGAYAVGAHVYATQYHPEMDLPYLAALIYHLAPEVGPAVAGPARQSLSAGPAAAPAFAEGLARFFEGAGAEGRP